MIDCPQLVGDYRNGLTKQGRYFKIVKPKNKVLLQLNRICLLLNHIFEFALLF